MLKEIFEQPKAVADTLIGRLTDNNQIELDELKMSNEEIRALKKIVVIACGTAYHAGMIAKYAIEKWAKISVEEGETCVVSTLCEVEVAIECNRR